MSDDDFHAHELRRSIDRVAEVLKEGSEIIAEKLEEIDATFGIMLQVMQDKSPDAKLLSSIERIIQAALSVDTKAEGVYGLFHCPKCHETSRCPKCG